MKTKLIILSSKDILFTIPLLNLLSLDNRIDIQNVYFIKEKKSLVKKFKISLLLNFQDFIKILFLKIKSIFIKKNFFKEIFFTNVNSQSFINSINNNDIDLIVCINCPQILKAKTIKDIKFPIYNFHPGDIPRFRGVMIPFFVLKFKLDKACVTFHKIDEKIDKGKIIAKNYLTLSNYDTIFSIYQKIFLSKQTLDFIIASIINPKTQYIDVSQDTDKYYTYPSIKELLKFRFRLK